MPFNAFRVVCMIIGCFKAWVEMVVDNKSRIGSALIRISKYFTESRWKYSRFLYIHGRDGELMIQRCNTKDTHVSWYAYDWCSHRICTRNRFIFYFIIAASLYVRMELNCWTICTSQTITMNVIHRSSQTLNDIFFPINFSLATIFEYFTKFFSIVWQSALLNDHMIG